MVVDPFVVLDNPYVYGGGTEKMLDVAVGSGLVVAGSGLGMTSGEALICAGVASDVGEYAGAGTGVFDMNGVFGF